jgi:hypothetical protein
MRSLRAVATILFAATAFILPTVGTAAAATPTAASPTTALPPLTSAATPYDTPWY